MRPGGACLWFAIGVLLYCVSRNRQSPQLQQLSPKGSNTSQEDDTGLWELGWVPDKCSPFSKVPPQSRLLERCESDRSAHAYCQLRLNGSLCAMWESGHWIDKRTGGPRSVTSRDLQVALRRSFNIPPPSFADAVATLVRTGQEYTSPLELLAVLEHLTKLRSGARGRGLLIGDSMLRQLQARLVLALRGLQPAFEHTSLGEVVYEAFAHGDAFILAPRGAVQASKRGGKGRLQPAPARLPSPSAGCLVRLDFVWAATAREYPLQLLTDHLSKSSVAFHLHGLMYWTGTDPSATAAAASAASARRLFETMIEGWNGTRLGMFTTPPREPSRTTDHQEWNRFIDTRNAALRHAVRNTSASLFDWWAAVHRTPEYDGWLQRFRKDDKHFMCTFDQKAPSPPTLAREDEAGCTDPVNSAVLSTVLLAWLGGG